MLPPQLHNKNTIDIINIPNNSYTYIIWNKRSLQPDSKREHQRPPLQQQQQQNKIENQNVRIQIRIQSQFEDINSPIIRRTDCIIQTICLRFI